MSIRVRLSRASACLVLAACVATLAGACGKPCAHSGGPVAGPADAHCAGVTPVVVDAAACTATRPTPQTTIAGDGNASDGNASDANSTSEYGATMYNARGDDDDCKYKVQWSASPICVGEHVTFSVTVNYLTTGAPVTGANPRMDVYLNSTHPAPNSNPTATEISPGTYLVTPIEFDASGQWTIRFHLFENCLDADNSPHGHAAFYVNVP